MTRLLRFAPALSTLALTCATLSACAVEGSGPGGDDALDLRYEELAEEYLLVERPANEDMEPAEQPCSSSSAVASCLDLETVAFCGQVDGEGLQQFGECMEPEELTCIPGEFISSGWCGDQVVCKVNAAGVPFIPQVDCGEPPTPLVLNFDNAPITMLAAEQTPAATFDIEMAADGSSCISTDWPSAATPWLAIDLDGNGSIDGGHELFGSGTRLAAGTTAQNGFEALAAYDSNADGRIDAGDEAFGRLLLWRDHDADRLSSPDELEPLADSGVDSLALDYLVDAQCDARGNCGVERVEFSHAGGRGELVDLHLPCR